MNYQWTIATACVMSLTLTACFVEEEDIPARQRTTDNLRVYLPGDYLEYDVTGSNTSANGTSALTGVLRISYASHANLPAPLSGSGTIPDPVKQETSVLSINLGAVEYSEGVVRFVAQDSQGTMSLYAIDAPGVDTYYWVNDLGSLISLPPAVPPVVITTSPFVIENRSYSYYALSGCNQGAARCDEAFALLSEPQNIVGTDDITTNIGKFDAFVVSINAATLIKLGADPNLVTTVDFRHFCTSINSAQVGGATFNGSMWVVPEVGVVKYDIKCTNVNNGETTRMVASLTSTNINLPE